MITAIAIDDEPPALRVIEAFCAGFGFITLQKTFTRTDEALRHLRKHPVDLLFLDIQMPSLSGIELYRALEQPLAVIFTTAYSEYAVEGFNLNATDYLLKPFTRERFAQAVQKAEEYIRYTRQRQAPENDYLLIRADYNLHKIAIGDIEYIEGLDDYIRIHLQQQKPVVARMTMKHILEKLEDRDFVRVHRSYIVPLSRIQHVRNKMISLGDAEIAIGSSYEEAFFARFRS
ncbi:LytR/AlgR family response regulator transcription factor [Taibaiella chishuiensis]|uniref:LytTR family two component transcriptional regulator n=1 Tax=Taibaiella chishuiensis TaxID=1434707 RepID=A0A2P8DA38_9BACT|nr:LytTR family DNA-binding domain-containing protein [Taibaiella chishuiensis]PSK94075.1 LytTR family two component transcriptional regulator [Taibaiella chishuiensis]